MKDNDKNFSLFKDKTVIINPKSRQILKRKSTRKTNSNNNNNIVVKNNKTAASGVVVALVPLSLEWLI